jgi:serine/threonine protein kinase
MGADKETGEIVALKRINTNHKENGYLITAIREIKILNTLKHDNIVKLIEVVTDNGEFFIKINIGYCTRDEDHLTYTYFFFSKILRTKCSK